jgi:TPP-dependent pyruvate/acetoin dehydrogenase alpha subunit
MYWQMQRIRRFEEEIALCAEAKEFGGPTHLYIGQEAVAVGVCALLRRDDLICGGHRSHGHYLAKGGGMPELAAEIFGRSTGCAGGRGGSMHLVCVDVGLLGTSALVGGGMGVGVGAALANSLAGLDRVSAIFFGDGAVEEGVFSETLNFAALKRLPVLYVCENNLYSSHMPISTRQPVGEIWRYAEPYGIPGIRLDGNDVIAVYEAAAIAVTRSRNGEGPTLLECMTYRWRGHVGPAWDLDKGLRSREEIDAWMARDPIERMAARLEADDVLTAKDRARIDQEVDAEVASAITFARTSPFPDPATLLDRVYR